jgi:hypothetical protein
MSLGRPGETSAPELGEAVKEVETRTREAGLAFGIAGGGVPAPDLLSLAAGDVDFFVYSLDLRIYAESADRVAGEARHALSEAKET